MSDRASYSRVYWSIMDDAKFDGIREDVKHFGSWSLLLIVADMAWPAPAYVPPSIPRASYRALVAAELVDELPGGRFRIHGLNAERTRRREAATRPPTNRPPRGTQRVPNGDPNGPLDEDETRRGRDETRLDEGEVSARAEEAWDAPETPVVQWLAQHGCYIAPSGGYRQQLITAVERHGAMALIGTMEGMAEAGQKNGDVKGFVFGAIDFLDKQARPNITLLEKEDRAEEAERTFQNRVQATIQQAHRTGFHESEPDARCELCKSGAA